MAVSEIRQEEKRRKINVKKKIITFLYILLCFSCQFLLINLLREVVFICEKKSILYHQNFHRKVSGYAATGQSPIPIIIFRQFHWELEKRFFYSLF